MTATRLAKVSLLTAYGQALLAAGCDLPQCIEMFLQESLGALIDPMQADT